MAQRGARVAVVDDSGQARSVTKIVGLRDGGFAVTVPYHSARRGFLFKLPVDYAAQQATVALSEVMPYTAEDRVKLSLHIDGFVQFSGEGTGRIVSGRGPDGSPKGLGLIANPLTTPLSTQGPTFALTAWGLEKFESPRKGRPSVPFGPSDIYYRDCTASEWNGYIVEGFVYPRSFLTRATMSAGRLLLSRTFPNFAAIPRESGLVLPTAGSLLHPTAARFDLTLIDVGSPYIIVALLVSRVLLDMGAPSGFSLSSPSDMRHALAAVYPNPFATGPAEARSLDYTPAEATGAPPTR